MNAMRTQRLAVFIVFVAIIGFAMQMLIDGSLHRLVFGG